MLDRNRRCKIAVCWAPRATAGKINGAIAPHKDTSFPVEEPMPVIGNQSSLMEKKKINSRASAKLGMARPPMENPVKQ